MAFTLAQIADITETTREKVAKNMWVDLASTLYNYVGAKQLMNKKRTSVDAGRVIQWKVQVDHGDNARSTKLYDQDATAKFDMFKTAEIPWRYQQTSWMYDEREQAANVGDSEIQLINFVKAQEIAAQQNLIELFEGQIWGVPADANDDLTLYGMKYWLPFNNTTAAGGFEGGTPFGSTVASINPTTYPAWQHWTATYSDVTKTDLIEKWRRAFLRVQWNPPVNFPELGKGLSDFGYYCGSETVLKLETALENQNDNLGNDIDSKGGKTVFRGVPVVHSAKLDADTQEPVYGINWNTFELCVMQGWWWKRSGTFRDDQSHNVMKAYIDCTANLKCVNRRKNFVLFQAA